MKVVHINKPKIKDENKDFIDKWSDELIKEFLSDDIRAQEKKRGLDLTELRIKYNVF